MAAAESITPDREREMLSATDPSVRVRKAFATSHRFIVVAPEIIRLILDDSSVQIPCLSAGILNLFDVLSDADLDNARVKAGILRAYRRDVPSHIRLIFANDEDVEVRRLNAQQATISPRPTDVLITAFMNDPNARVRAALASRHNLWLTDDEALQLAADRDVSVRIAIAGSALIRIRAVMDLLVADPDPTVRVAALASHTSVTGPMITRLSRDKHASVRIALINFVELGQAPALLLAVDPEVEVRVAVAKSALTVWEGVTELLVADTDARVKVALLQSKAFAKDAYTPTHRFDAHVRTAHPTSRITLTDAELLTLTDDPSFNVRLNVAKKTLAEQGDIAEKLATDLDPKIRIAVIKSKGRFTVQRTLALIVDADPQVRKSIAKHGDLTAQMLDDLANDVDETVRDAATDRFISALSGGFTRKR